MQAHVHTKTGLRMLAAALFVIAAYWKQAGRSPSIMNGEVICKLSTQWKSNERLIPAATRTDRKIIMPSEEATSEKVYTV